MAPPAPAAPAQDDATPFHDLPQYMAIPRLGALRLAPDGSWLAAAVQTLSSDKKKWVTSIWRVDPDGGKPRRLTRSAEGEGSPRFLPDGSLLFVSKRPAEQAAKNGTKPDETPALWELPADGGEAALRTRLPGGVSAVEVGAVSGTVVVASPVLPAAGPGLDDGDPAAGPGADPGDGTAADDERLRQRRKDAGITAILHESVPVRYWDHDLGPAELRLFLAEAGAQQPRDLTPDALRAFFEQTYDVSPDGSKLATGWWRWMAGNTQSYVELVLVDTLTGARRTLLSDHRYLYENPRFSPDGTQLVAVRSEHHTPEKPHDITLVLVGVAAGSGVASGTEVGSGVASGAERDLLPGFDRWPASAVWSPDGSAVYFTADDSGRHPIFKVSIATGQVTKVTADHGAYSEVNPAPDNRTLFALRAAIDAPPTPVRVDVATGAVTPLDAPGTNLAIPGHVEEIVTTADDGHPIQSWLVLPDRAAAGGGEAAGRHPMLLWVHGGPMMSWNSWSWRWNPWLMAARGYAVLLPNPALSTGWGQEFIERGYHSWGERPFNDIMAATDAAEARPDIDETSTGMMGGSYGGYMANWIAGHTDRFKAIVSHAGLWALDQMFGTTDMPMFWRPQFGDPATNPEMYLRNSPHHHLEQIITPMLVIHGNKDYRVPLSEALRLWWDLNRTGAEAKFLYFPDENHWILTPGNATVWYETIYAFLAQHVLGEPWRRPDLL
jgi:dipeptidyl aminopeptidase/acylaminoacyl peptidase